VLATAGFDFGTSTTLIASPAGVVPIGTRVPWMPSVVGFLEDGSVVVGENALREAPHPIRSIKRMITDNRDYVRSDPPAGPRDVPADELMVALLAEAVRLGQAGGQALRRSGVVRLGCPAMWDGEQRRRLLRIAQRAGLPVTLATLVDEPVAAGIAWLAATPRDTTKPLRVLVFDMGGGTLDLAVLDVRGAGHQDLSVLAAFGVAEAGDSLDDVVAADLDLVIAAAGVDIDTLAKPLRARETLVDAARDAKVALTYDTEHPVVLDPRFFGNLEIWYTRKQLNAVFEEQMDRAESYVLLALQIAALSRPGVATAADLTAMTLDALVGHVDVVVLSGGMSRIPYVADRLKGLFPATTRIELATASPEDAVALGLAKAAQYGRINMYRPAFDIRIDWNRGRESRVIYQAYTPLVEPAQFSRAGGELRFARTARQLSLPRKTKARLRVVSHSGEPVHAGFGGDKLDGYRVRLNEQEFEFAIYPSGRLRLVDGTGVHDGQILDWAAG
jgi:molecular chaperone DnaK (HSP70)